MPSLDTVERGDWRGQSPILILAAFSAAEKSYSSDFFRQPRAGVFFCYEPRRFVIQYKNDRVPKSLSPSKGVTTAATVDT